MLFRYKSALLIFFFCIAGISTLAQTPDHTLEPKLESIAEGNEENQTDLVQLAERLGQLREHRVKINFADHTELEAIPGLDVFQINNLLQYRSRSGMLYSKYELTQIKGFDRATIEQLLPYLDFSTELDIPDLKLKNIIKYSRHELIYRTDYDLQQRAGFKTGAFTGPPGNHYLRYRGRYRNTLSYALLGQQDAGEPFNLKPGVGFDFYSGHIALQNYGKIKTLIVGDFQLEFGQGLAAWTGLAFGKGAQVNQTKRFARGIRPYAGAEENRFMRGVANQLKLGAFSITSFYSNHRIDANVLETDTLFPEQPAFVSSLQSTGLHRTEGELQDKNANRLQSYGGNVEYRGQGFSLGATAIQNRLSNPLIKGNQLYQQYNLNGNAFSNYSLDFNRLWRNFNLFGEVALNQNQKAAMTAGSLCRLADNVMFSVLYRQLDKEYSSLYNASFAESGSNGEHGLYTGLEWNPYARMTIKAYADHYRFSWPRYNAAAPSKGADYLLQWEHNPSRFFTYYLRYRSENQSVNGSEVQTPQLQKQSRQGLRMHLNFTAGSAWKLANRLEYAWHKETGLTSRGFLLFQDISYKPTNKPLQLSARFALVETTDFDSRIYAYERDVLYAFSIPAYYGRSFRFYLLGGYALTKNIRIQLRYARTQFFDRSDISSGANAIEGNVQSEVKGSVRFTF
jgi:hypothetical protein